MVFGGFGFVVAVLIAKALAWAWMTRPLQADDRDLEGVG